MSKYTYIDLFAGCGGLSVGFEKAGFDLELAIEKSEMACETFYHNFVKRLNSKAEWEEYCRLPVKDQAKNKLVVNTLKSVLDDKALMNELKKKKVDVVMGGPPCQGFSMAGRRNPKDIRNQLPWQFMEFVETVSPKMVIMENVVGMTRNFSKHDTEAPFMQLYMQLQKTGMGYEVQPVMLNTMHYGIPQHRPRVMLLGLRKDVAKKLKLTFLPEIYKSEFDNPKNKKHVKRPEIVPLAKYFDDELVTAESAFWDIDDDGYKHGVSDKKYNGKSGAYAKMLRSDAKWMRVVKAEKGGSDKLLNQTVRKHNEIAVDRFRLYQYLKECGLGSKLVNLFAGKLGEAEKTVMLNDLKTKAKFPAKSPDGKLIAKNLDELKLKMKVLATRKHSQRPIDLSKPAPTMVTLPDDFVHPTIPRILSVREMARIQSFPDNFEFKGKETTGGTKRRIEVPQYTQVGNAVAPLIAFELGKNFMKLLKSAE